MKTKPIIFIYISVAVILWGFSFIWTNQLIETGTPVFTFIFFRMLLAGVILLLISIIGKKLQKMRKKDFLLLAVMALFEPFIYFIGETFGLKATGSPTLSALIIATIPLFTLVSGQIFYKEKITWVNIIGVIVTIPGILLMVLDKGKFSVEYWWGIALLFLAVFGATGYTTIVKKLSDRYNSYTITTYMFLIAALYFLPLFLAFNGDFKASQFLTKEILRPLIALAALCSSLAFVFYINSVRELGITRASIFSALIPAVSAIIAYFIGAETFSVSQILGIVIVILGVIVTQKR